MGSLANTIGATNALPERAALLAKLAVWGCALVVLIMATSALLRFDKLGLGCTPWPQCYEDRAAQVGEVPNEAESASVIVSRVVHRVSAMVAVPVVAAIALVLLSRRPRAPGDASMGVTLVLLIAGLSILGRYSAGHAQPAVALGNLLGGHVLLASLWWVRLRNSQVSTAHGLHRCARGLCLAALVMVAAQIVIGGLISVKLAAAACTAFPDCDGAWLPVRLTFDALNPFVARGEIEAAALTALHLAHRLNALLLAALLIALGVLLLRSLATRALAQLLLALIALQATLGAVAVLAGLPPPLLLAHNLTAACLLLTLMTTLRALPRSRAE